MIGQLPEIFKKNERFLRPWLKPLSAEIAAAPMAAASYFLIFASYRGGWGPAASR
jgi:hypothetical protein